MSEAPFDPTIDLRTRYLGLELEHPLVASASPLSADVDGIRRLEDDFRVGPDAYLELVRRAKAAVDIPVIGSLNGSSPGGWTHYAEQIERAGADALELNVYFLPTDPNQDAAQVEQRYLDTLRDVLVVLEERRAQPPTWRCGCSAPALRGWCCSTASTSPTSTPRRSRWARAWCCPPPRRCGWRCAGPRSCTAACRSTSA